MIRSALCAAPAAALLLAMAACGSQSEAGENATGTPGGSPATMAGAAQAGEDGLGKLKCPARIDKRLSGPDIAGLRLGMSLDEAVNVTRCHAKDAIVVFEDRWFDPYAFRTHQMKLERQVLIAQSGETSACDYSTYNGMQACGLGQRAWDRVDEKIRVAVPGLPGAQTVVGIWRTQTYRDSEMPAIETVIAALTEKYGPYQRRTVQKVNNNLWSDRIELAWASDTSGTPFSEANPIFLNCAVNVHARAEEGQTWQDGCGLSIAVTILAPRANPAVAGELSVGMMNQSEVYAYQEDLQLKLDDIEAARRDDELDKARSSDVDL